MHVAARFFIGVVSVVFAVFGVTESSLFNTSVIAGKGEVIESGAVARTAPLSATQSDMAAPPSVVDISPSDGSQDVMLDIEDPIRVRFDATVADFFVDFRLDPEMPVTYENNPEKTEFKLLPKASLISGTSYTLKTFIKRRGMDDSTYMLLSTSQFSTPKEILTPEQQTIADKLSNARQNTEAKITQGKYIDVSLANQVMVLFEDGQALDAYLVSSGKRGMDTPKGQFKIENKTKRAWSKSYGLYMPYWMAITPSGKFGIHELPEWPSGYKEGASHLGIPVSHGCVRLGVGSAARVFEFADTGTPVIVH